MDATVSRFGFSGPSTRFQPTTSRVCTSALQHRMPPPSMHFTRQRMPEAGTTMVPPVCARYTALTTTPPSSLIRMDTALKRISVQAKAKVGHNHNAPDSWLRSSQERDHCADFLGKRDLAG